MAEAFECGERAWWVEQVRDEMAAFPNGENDDLHDAAVYGLLRIRQGGLMRLSTAAARGFLPAYLLQISVATGRPASQRSRPPGLNRRPADYETENRPIGPFVLVVTKHVSPLLDVQSGGF
jgi:hypothetical protein